MFNGPLYIPVVSLALLTEGRTARDLPKQRWSKKKGVAKGLNDGMVRPNDSPRKGAMGGDREQVEPQEQNPPGVVQCEAPVE